MNGRVLIALPVFNEAAHVGGVLDQVARHNHDILVVDDGSTDATPELLAARPDVRVIRHPVNLGYGAAVRSAFAYAIRHGYDVLVTLDCDGQHEPQLIPDFAAACREADVVSGSRYLRAFPGQSASPEQRRRINRIITAELNRRLHLQLTDAFCGFKAYRVAALESLRLTERGYAMPIEFWVQAVRRGLSIVERPVPLIYLEEKRSFGGSMDDPVKRLRVYRQVLRRALREVEVVASAVSGS